MTRIRIGIIGCGDIAGYHAGLILGSRVPTPPPNGSPPVRALKSAKRAVRRMLNGSSSTASPGILETEIVAAADLDKEKVENFCRRFDIPASYTQYKDLLARSDVDVVFICTPPFLHAEIAVAAARAGKHVFCEKPMAMSSAECDLMIEASEQTKTILQIGYVLRFSNERGRIRTAILDGEIGRPVFWRETFNVSAGPPQKWVHNEQTGKGPLWENSHILDLFIHTLGLPSEVFGLVSRLKPEDTTAYDTIAALLKFPSGDVALFTDSYAFPGFGWHLQGCRSNQCQIDVAGPKGLIEYPTKDLANALTIFHYDRPGQETRSANWTSDWGADGYLRQLQHFFDCVRTGEPTLCSGNDASQAIRLAETILESAKAGRSISVAKVA